MRLSMGIAWMVIVAAEMLSGGTGIGFFVWDSWNALSLERVHRRPSCSSASSGLVLDRGFDELARRSATRSIARNDGREPVADSTRTRERPWPTYTCSFRTWRASSPPGRALRRRQGHQPGDRPRRVRQPDRPLRLRQVDGAQHPGRPAAAHARARCCSTASRFRAGADRGMVFQNYSLLPWLSVYDNVYEAVDSALRDKPARREGTRCVERYPPRRRATGTTATSARTSSRAA